MKAYAFAKNEAIIFKISLSLLVVSSKPGVSSNRILHRRKVDDWGNCKSNAWDTWTSAVQERRLEPTGRFEPLARLTNYGHVTHRNNICYDGELTVDFPVPVAPMTLH